MNTQDILSAIDAEIARLQAARTFLAGTASTKRRGRPLGSSASLTPKKRTMSAAGRKRIADAQRKRWAKAKRG